MKLVQSFLLPKTENQDPRKILNNSSFGFDIEKRRMFWYTLVWSFMSGYKNCKNIELITDSIGRFILIDCLKLPYNSVKIELDNLEPEYKFIGKIKAYSLQTEPFLHYDFDVIFRDFFPFESINYKLYGQILRYADRNLSYRIMNSHNFLKINEYKTFPLELNDITIDNIKNHKYLNAGVFGGNDLDLIKQHSLSVLNLYHEVCTKQKNEEFPIEITDYTAFFSLLEEYLPVLMYKNKYKTLDGIGAVFNTGIKDSSDESMKIEKKEIEKQNKINKYVHLADIKNIHKRFSQFSEKEIKEEEIIRNKIINYVRKTYPEQTKTIDLFLKF